MIERLKRGELNTEMDPMHTILYKHTFKTTAKDWKAMLERTYFWIDWFSMPQPGAEKVEDIGEKEMNVLRAEGSMAIRSIPAYVERSDFILILVPSLYHSDRKVPTCYRTWRRRGWCLLELYAAVMARDSSNPPLLVRSERGTPMWMSPLEILKLSIGLADFTCCQRNHVITTETQKVMNNGGEVKKIPCDKPIAGGILKQLSDAKIDHLFNAEADMVMARWHIVLKHWWMRGLKKKEKIVADENATAVQKLKKMLRWDTGKSWFDREGMGLLMYAVTADEFHVVSELLQMLKRDFNDDEYTRRLESRLQDEGYVSLGVPGRITALMAAMSFASADVVSILLENGSNIESVDTMGHNAFMLASVFGRSRNLEYWIGRFPKWDLEKRNATMATGVTALFLSAYFGAGKYDCTKLLLKAGCRANVIALSGDSILHLAAENEDSDPDVIRLILERIGNTTRAVNMQSRASAISWQALYFTAKFLYRTRISKSALFRSLAIEVGMSPLHRAVVRGDVEIVKIFLEHGADPYVENDLGMNAFEICDEAGPFPSVRNILEESTAEESK